MEDLKKSLSKKSEHAHLEPLLNTAAEEEKEVEVTDPAGEMSLNILNSSLTNANGRLRRFLRGIGLDLEDLSAFVTDQGENPETFIQTLQQLFDHEKSCSSGFKWATLDHLVEKYLQWPFLSKSDLSGDSKCCTARVKPAQRSILLKSLPGLIKAYGARSFVKGVEFTLSRTVRYFIYSMVTYRIVDWYQTGRLDFQEFRQVFDKNTEKGVDTLVRELSKVQSLYLNLILSSPLIIGGLFALNGMRGAKSIKLDEIQSLVSELTEQLKPILSTQGDTASDTCIGFLDGFRTERTTEQEMDYLEGRITKQFQPPKSWVKNTFQEFFPPFSWFSTSSKLQKLEKLIRWDGRISSEERLQLFDALRQTAQKSHQLTQIYAMGCLAKIAHGVGFKDLHKLKEAGYNPEALRSIVYTKTLVLQTLSELTQSNPDHPVLALPRRLYATYLLWWLGLSTSYPKQKIPFSVFKAIKTALEISFLYEITNSIVTAINCPDKPGYKFAEGFADWASEYSLECFVTALQFFRSIDLEENVEEFVKKIDQYHLTDLKSLDLNDKYLNATELYTLIQAIVKRAPHIEELKIGENSFDTLILGTFNGLRLRNLDLSNNFPLTMLPAGVFQGLSQLESLDLSNPQLSTLLPGVFQGLGQLQSLYLNATQLTMMPSGTFKGLIQLQRLSLSGWFTTLPIRVFQDLGQLRHLDLRNSQLTTLPARVFEGLNQLQYLDLSNNFQLTNLPAGVFEGLCQLQYLDLSNNFGLTNLSFAVFEGLSQLQHLDLSKNNQLTSLPSGIFKGLGQSLQHLDLSENLELSRLPFGVFEGLDQLKTLTLDATLLTDLSPDIFDGLTQLQCLNLGRSLLLTSLPSGIFDSLSQLENLTLGTELLISLPSGIFDGLSQLQHLDLSMNGSLPSRIFESLTQLRSLSLSGGIIIQKSDVFKGLSQLQILSFDVENLSSEIFENLGQLQTLHLGVEQPASLSSGIFKNLGQLQNLHLVQHELTSLPSGMFVGLNQLKSLMFMGASLTNLPLGVFEGLSQLQSLSLTDNPQLTTLSAGVFQSLSQLQILDLRCPLRNLSSWVFEGLSQLKVLYLGGELTSRSVGVFEGLDQLKVLYLQGGTTSLSSGVFRSLGQLEILDLSRTQLTSLPSRVFEGLDQLQRLDLSNNFQLTSLPAGVFDGLGQLQYLDLSNNWELASLSSGVFSGLGQLQTLDLTSSYLTNLSSGVFEGLDRLQYLNLNRNRLNDTAISNMTQGLPYSLQTLYVALNYISNTGAAALLQLLPCSNISNFLFIPSDLPLNDTALLLQQQRKTLERVCADRSCHANLPSKSCPPDSFYGRTHPQQVSALSDIWYTLPTPLTWVGAASSSLHILSSCSEASNPVVMIAGGSALVVGSVGLGVLFYKNCTVLQSFVATGRNFVMRCVYGKAQKPSAEPVETHLSSTPAALRAETKRSSICNLFGTFFKPAKNPPPNLDVPVYSPQAMQL